MAVVVLALSVTMAMRAQVNTNAPSGLIDRPTTQQPAKPATPDKEKNKETSGHDNNKDNGNTGSQGEYKQGKENSHNSDASSDKKKSNEGKTVAGHRGGYRIQAMIATGSKGKSQATTRAREIASKYPHYRTYISYKAPSWRLRIGDFEDHDDAKSALAKMRRSFPSFSGEMSVVRDKINVWK